MNLGTTPILIASLLAVVPVSASADVLPDEDTTPPEVTIVAPENGAVIEDTPIVVQVEASDPESGVAAVILRVDTEDVGAPKSAPPFEWESVALTPGEHTIYAQATNGEDLDGFHEIVVTVQASGEAAEEGGGADAGEGDGDGEGDGGGCSASARPRTMIASGVAFALALVAGAMLRRRAR